MRGIVTQFAGGKGIIKPRDGGAPVRFGGRWGRTIDKSLALYDEVDYELSTDGTCSVVFKVR